MIFLKKFGSASFEVSTYEILSAERKKDRHREREMGEKQKGGEGNKQFLRAIRETTSSFLLQLVGTLFHSNTIWQAIDFISSDNIQ